MAARAGFSSLPLLCSSPDDEDETCCFAGGFGGAVDLLFGAVFFFSRALSLSLLVLESELTLTEVLLGFICFFAGTLTES